MEEGADHAEQKFLVATDGSEKVAQRGRGRADIGLRSSRRSVGAEDGYELRFQLIQSERFTDDRVKPFTKEPLAIWLSIVAGQGDDGLPLPCRSCAHRSQGLDTSEGWHLFVEQNDVESGAFELGECSLAVSNCHNGMSILLELMRRQ